MNKHNFASNMSVVCVCDNLRKTKQTSSGMFVLCFFFIYLFLCVNVFFRASANTSRGLRISFQRCFSNTVGSGNET